MRLIVFFSFLLIPLSSGAMFNGNDLQVTVELGPKSLRGLKSTELKDVVDNIDVVAGLDKVDKKLQKMLKNNSQVIVQELVNKSSRVLVKIFT